MMLSCSTWLCTTKDRVLIAMQLQHQRLSEASIDVGVEAEGSATSLLHNSSSSYFMGHIN